MNRLSEDPLRVYLTAFVALMDGIEKGVSAFEHAKDMATWNEVEGKLPGLIKIVKDYSSAISKDADFVDEIAQILIEHGELSIAERAFELSRIARVAPGNLSLVWCRHRAWFRANGFATSSDVGVSVFAMPAEDLYQHIRSIISGKRKPRSDGATESLKERALQLKEDNKSWTWKRVREELHRCHKDLLPNSKADDKYYPADATMQDWKRKRKRDSN